jgi:galactosamine-6-phosphate isomerase
LNVVRCATYEELSERAAALVTAEIARRPGLLLCAATGHSPAGLYAGLAREAAGNRERFAALRVVKLDEWGGLGAGDAGSSEAYLRRRLLEPLGVTPDRYLALAGDAADPAAECERVRGELERRGPIDLCILGLGVNGHLGFNEPNTTLIPQCHIAALSPESRRHAMARSMAEPPAFGLTLGLREILASRRVLLLVTGPGKAPAITALLSGAVTTRLPASFLWLHRHVDCLMDATAFPVSAPTAG